MIIQEPEEIEKIYLFHITVYLEDIEGKTIADLKASVQDLIKTKLDQSEELMECEIFDEDDVFITDSMSYEWLRKKLKNDQMELTVRVRTEIK